MEPKPSCGVSQQQFMIICANLSIDDAFVDKMGRTLRTWGSNTYIWWDAQGAVHQSRQLLCIHQSSQQLRIQGFSDPRPDLRRVHRYVTKLLDEILSTVIARIPDLGSSINSRPLQASSDLLTKFNSALVVDFALAQGGSVRGMSDQETGCLPVSREGDCLETTWLASSIEQPCVLSLARSKPHAARPKRSCQGPSTPTAVAQAATHSDG